MTEILPAKVIKQISKDFKCKITRKLVQLIISNEIFYMCKQQRLYKDSVQEGAQVNLQISVAELCDLLEIEEKKRYSFTLEKLVALANTYLAKVGGKISIFRSKYSYPYIKESKLENIDKYLDIYVEDILSMDKDVPACKGGDITLSPAQNTILSYMNRITDSSYLFDAAKVEQALTYIRAIKDVRDRARHMTSLKGFIKRKKDHYSVASGTARLVPAKGVIDSRMNAHKKIRHILTEGEWVECDLAGSYIACFEYLYRNKFGMPIALITDALKGGVSIWDTLTADICKLAPLPVTDEEKASVRGIIKICVMKIVFGGSVYPEIGRIYSILNISNDSDIVDHPMITALVSAVSQYLSTYTTVKDEDKPSALSYDITVVEQDIIAKAFEVAAPFLDSERPLVKILLYQADGFSFRPQHFSRDSEKYFGLFKSAIENHCKSTGIYATLERKL